MAPISTSCSYVTLNDGKRCVFHGRNCPVTECSRCNGRHITEDCAFYGAIARRVANLQHLEEDILRNMRYIESFNRLQELYTDGIDPTYNEFDSLPKSMINLQRIDCMESEQTVITVTIPESAVRIPVREKKLETKTDIQYFECSRHQSHTSVRLGGKKPHQPKFDRYNARAYLQNLQNEASNTRPNTHSSTRRVGSVRHATKSSSSNPVKRRKE
jgi:hypothetical protein